MSVKMPPRAVAAIAELRTAAATIRTTTTPSDTDRALVAVLEASASYWALWFPESPTAMDRAVLMLARAINEAPAAAAGTQPHPSSNTEQKAV